MARPKVLERWFFGEKDEYRPPSQKEIIMLLTDMTEEEYERRERDLELVRKRTIAHEEDLARCGI